MKPWLRFLLGLAAGLVAASSAYAQKITPTGVSATPSSVKPGDQVTFTVAASNNSLPPSAPTDFNGTVDIAIVFTNIVTGTSFTISQTGVSPTGGLIGKATVDPTTNQTTPGVGSFPVTGTVPISTTDAGAYRATATFSNITPGTLGGALGTPPSFSVSSTVLTVTGQPDFVLTSLTYSAGTSYKGGDVIPMSLTYTNAISTGGTFNVPFVPSGSGNLSRFRIQIVLSSNPTYGDADDFLLTFFDVNSRVNADGTNRTITWNQLLPGNYSGSYYVLAKIDSLNSFDETGEAAAAPQETNVWLDVTATKIALQPTNFPTLYVASLAGGATAGGYSDSPSVSADGRYTTFVSDAANLVANDTNNVRDVFIYDNQNSVVRRLSVSQQGAQANRASNNPGISGDGRLVAFESEATNLVFGDTNGFSDIFVVDAITGSITRESLSSGGVQANGSSFRPALSSDGRYVVFESTATNLVSPSTATGLTQIYLRDRTTGVTTLVSQSAGTAGNGNSVQATISADGKFAAFASDATNLVAGDTNGVQDVFLRDLVAGTTTRVSVATGGTQGNGGSRVPSINQDGRFVAFASDANNLVAGDTNGVTDVFVYDRVNARTTRVSVSSAGAQATDPTDASVTGSQLGSFNPSISATGRYVVFPSLANNLAPGDNVGRYNAAGSGNSAVNIYVADRDTTATGVFDTAGNISTTNVSVNRFGYQAYYILNVQSTAAADIHPVISGDGRWVSFPSDAESSPGLIHGATNMVSPDANGARDIITFDRRINALPNPATLPTVALSSPINGTSYPINSAIDLIANATTQIGTVASVQFFANGTSLGAPVTTFPYKATWTPVAMGNYVLSALVTDSFGNQAISNNVNIAVVPISPLSPTVAVTGPLPTASLFVGNPITVTATASDPDGTVTSVQLFSNGISIGTATSSPFSVTFTPTATGNYSLTALATDNGGNHATSAPVVVTVINPVPPTVGITSPENGASVSINSTVALHATSASTNGTVKSVQFLANGAPIITVTSSPFDAQWTPTAAGLYQLTAVATDNFGAQTTSSAVTVLVVANGVGNTVYNGSFGAGDNGRFSLISIGGKSAAFIGYSTLGAGKAYYYSGITLDAGGGFSVTDAGGRVLIAGQTSDTGVTISSLDGAAVTYIGIVTFSAGTPVGTGYYTGSIAGRPASQLAAIVGPNGSIALFASDGSTRTAGVGSVSATGTFTNIAALGGGTFSGKVDPLTGFLTGNLTGPIAGGLMAASESGVSFSDGFLRNLSSRGQVGTGTNALVAGFVVGGTTNKNVLIRAVGPSLAQFGITGALADPQLQLFGGPTGQTVISSNNNWGGTAQLSNAAGSVGAFPLSPTSLDAVVLATLAPGNYTAQVTGVGGVTGTALVELYDVDNPSPYSSQKVINISTRALVGTGQNRLIAGFVINGNTPKKVLVRAVGPTLGAAPFSVPGFLADPVLRIIRNTDNFLVRENDNWETGNDTALVGDAATRSGAFPLAAGSKDAAILINLPPGSYSAEVTGSNSSTGVALVEVYEVP